MSRSPSPASCARVVSRLDRWLDGALPATEAALDRGHMEACAACDGERERRARMLERIRCAARVEAHELPELDVLWEGLAARLGDARPARARQARRLPAFPAFIGAAAAVLALYLLQAAGGASVRTLHPEDAVSVRQVLDVLPGWSDVVRGVSSLSRSLS